MKVVFEDKKVYVYLYNTVINIDDFEDVNNEIKKVFIRLIKKYQLNFNGYNKVIIYYNSNYGLIIEIENVYQSINTNNIDLKIVIYKDVDMYLEFDDYCFTKKPKKLIMKDSKYYLDLNNISDITEYIEYGRVIFKKN